VIILCEGSAVVVVRWRERVVLVLVLVLERVLRRAMRERAPPKLGHWVSIEPGGLWVSWSSLTRCCARSPRHDWVVLRPLLRRTEGGGMDDGMARGGVEVVGCEAWSGGREVEWRRRKRRAKGDRRGRQARAEPRDRGKGGPARPIPWRQRTGSSVLRAAGNPPESDGSLSLTMHSRSRSG
jgi:hypothetical protein